MHKLFKLLLVCFIVVGCSKQGGKDDGETTTSNEPKIEQTTPMITTTEVPVTTTTKTPVTTTTKVTTDLKEKETSKNTTNTNTVKAGELIALNAKTVLEKLNDKETFIMYLGTTTCSACVSYKPIVEEVVAENNIIMYSVMLDGNDISNDMLASRVELKFTPTTLFIKDGEIKARYDYSITKEELIKFYKDNEMLAK